MEHRVKSKKSDDRGQMTASRTQRSEIRCLRSGLKPISDLRPLTSVMDGFYDFYDLNDLNEFNDLNDL